MQTMSLPPRLKSTLTGAAVTAALVPALALGACSGSGGDSSGSSSDGGTSGGSDGTVTGTATGTADAAPAGTGASTATGEVDVFLTVARAAGWNCIPGADPYTGKRGATCTPGAGEEMDRAVFAVFDRADVADGASAVRLARESGGAALDGQFLPLDSDTVSGYCVNTLNTCAASGFEALGLTLG